MLEDRLNLSEKEENANPFDVILEGRKGRGIFLSCFIYNVLAENMTALTIHSKVILTSISTSSGLYLYKVPLHSSCDSYKEKCHIAI